MTTLSRAALLLYLAPLAIALLMTLHALFNRRNKP